MCELYSWIEKDSEALFLTPYDVLETRRGRDLQKHTREHEDWHGHGAIRWFYHVQGGKERECADFSRPENFPSDLARAIKEGRMWGFGITENMHVMLEQTAWAEYLKTRQPALAEYEKIQQPALAEYKKARQTAWSQLWQQQQNRIKIWR